MFNRNKHNKLTLEMRKKQSKQHKNPLFDLLFVPHRLFSHLRTCTTVRVCDHVCFSMVQHYCYGWWLCCRATVYVLLYSRDCINGTLNFTTHFHMVHNFLIAFIFRLNPGYRVRFKCCQHSTYSVMACELGSCQLSTFVCHP